MIAVLRAMAGRTWTGLAGLVVLIIPAVWWLIGTPYFRSHDGDIHRWRIWEYWQVWRAGEIPVRWAPDLSYGFGSPLFTYYNPLPYTLGAIAQAWGLDSADAAKLVFAIALVLAPIGMYLLAADWYAKAPSRKWPALLAAAVYLYSPYLLVNVFTRGAMGEALGLGIAPWLLWAELRCLQRRDLGSMLTIAIALAALVLTHNLTALMLSPAALALAVYHLRSEHVDVQNRLRAMSPLAAAVAMAIALTAFFWLPMVGELGKVQIDRGRGSGGVQKFDGNFVSPPEAVQYQFIHDYRLDFGTEKPSLPHLGLIASSVVISALIAGTRRRCWWHGQEAFLVASILSALYFASPLSQPLWEDMAVLATFQFPWRFLAVVALFGAVAAGGLAAGRNGVPIGLFLSIALIVSAAWVLVKPVNWQRDWDTPANEREYERQTKLFGLTADEEFLPVWVKRDRWSLFDAPRGGWSTAATSLRDVALIDGQPGRWVFEVDAAEADRLVLDSFYFPTWSATIGGRPTTTRPSGELALLAVDIPQGRHRVTVYQDATLFQRLGVAMTVAAGFILVILLVQISRRQRLVRFTYLLMLLLAVAVAVAPFVAAPYTGSPSHYLPVPTLGASAGPANILGLRVDQSRLGTSGQLDFSLLLFVPRVPSSEQPILRARLVDGGGLPVAETSHEIGQGLRPTTIWQPGMVLRDQWEWWLPAGTAAGYYELEVALGDSPFHSIAGLPLGTSGARVAFDSLPPKSGMHPSVQWGEHLVLDNVDFEREYEFRPPPDLESFLLAQRRPTFIGAFSWRLLIGETVDSEAVVRLADKQGTMWHESKMSLSFLTGVARLQRGLRFQLPQGLPPGRYWIELLVRQSDGRVLPFMPHGRVQAELPRYAMELRRHDVPAPCDCLPQGAAGVGIDMGDGLRLLGYETAVHDDTVDVVAYWQARDRPERSYTTYIHLLDRDGRLVDQFDGLPYDGGQPTTKWAVGDVVPFAARMRMPPQGGPFRLRAGMYEFPGLRPLTSSDGRSDLPLGLVERAMPIEKAEVAFQGGVKLLGYRLERAGNDGTLTLYWQRSLPVGDAYSVFVHVLDSTGRLVAQGDGPPEMGERTTVEWPRGAVIVDPHRFTMPTVSPLRFRIGLYRLADNYRLPTEGGPDYVDLGELRWP